MSWEEDVIFSGSNRGIINIWDINSAKSICSLNQAHLFILLKVMPPLLIVLEFFQRNLIVWRVEATTLILNYGILEAKIIQACLNTTQNKSTALIFPLIIATY